MSKFKGTKGTFNDGTTSWKIREVTTNGTEGFEVIWSDDEECVTDHVYTKEDANLIANAPKLLDALQSAYKCSGERNYLTKPVLDEMLDAINSALGNEA